MFETIFEYLSLGWVRGALLGLYLFSTISTVIIIISENRNPVKSLAWMTVLIFLPILGLVFYIFFGNNLGINHKISRRKRRKLKIHEASHSVNYEPLQLSEESLQQINLGNSLTGASLYDGNDVDVYTNGADKFTQLKTDLSSAKRFINLQYYIFEDDNIGNEIANILIERAHAGVRIRIIYDHVGSFQVGNKFFKRMADAAIEVYPFLKVTFPQLGSRINWRNHRKLCIIDGEIGYIGGMNIADRYINGGNFSSWRDTHLRIKGSAIAALQHSFTVDWHFMGLPLPTDYVKPTYDSKSNIAIQLLTSGPASQWSNIAFMFHKAIANAKRRIYIQTPYFLPTDALLKDLITASLADVDVRIIIPFRSDSYILDFATASYITECIQAGVKFYFYKAGMLHSKVVIIDDEFVTVGSTNFDFRSFEHNFEANIFLYSHEFAKKMADIFHNDMDKSERVIRANWRKRPKWHRAAESIARLFAPIL